MRSSELAGWCSSPVCCVSEVVIYLVYVCLLTGYQGTYLWELRLHVHGIYMWRHLQTGSPGMKQGLGRLSLVMKWCHWIDVCCLNNTELLWSNHPSVEYQLFLGLISWVSCGYWQLALWLLGIVFKGVCHQMSPQQSVHPAQGVHTFSYNELVRCFYFHEELWGPAVSYNTTRN